MKTSEQINELATALSIAQGMMEPAKKNKTNPHFKNKYADLDSCWEACKGPMVANGLSIIQAPSYADGRIVITTRICHKSGQWIEESLHLKPMKDDPQAAGSAISYGRRYMLGMLGVTSDEDDDGNGATKRDIEHRPPPPAVDPLDVKSIFTNHPDQVALVSNAIKLVGGSKERRDVLCKGFYNRKATMAQVMDDLLMIEQNQEIPF